MTSWFIFLFSVALAAKDTITVKGIVTCNSQTAGNVVVRLWDKDSQFFGAIRVKQDNFQWLRMISWARWRQAGMEISLSAGKKTTSSRIFKLNICAGWRRPAAGRRFDSPYRKSMSMPRSRTIWPTWHWTFTGRGRRNTVRDIEVENKRIEAYWLKIAKNQKGENIIEARIWHEKKICLLILYVVLGTVGWSRSKLRWN